MLRTAVKPQWLGLLAVLVVVLVSFSLLGLWQLNVARDRGVSQAVRDAPHQPVVGISTVLRPHAGFPSALSGRRVQAQGRYAAARQVLVEPRRLDGAAGRWVLTPLVLDSGATLAVVRGFVRDGTLVPAPPAGAVSVVGSLAPGEGPADDGIARPPGELGSVDLSVLVNTWPGELYNAFVFAVTEQPAPPAAVAGLQRVPPPQVPHGLAWRNAAYALQWWVFALFAAYMWFRMVRDDAEARNEQPGTTRHTVQES